MRITILLIFGLLFACSDQHSPAQSELNSLRAEFEAGYLDLHINRLEIGYLQNLEKIKSLDSVLIQEQFFNVIKNDLSDIDITKLSVKDQIDVEIMHYETVLNLERLRLEKKWLNLDIDTIPKTGLSHVIDGKEWYSYFLRRWVDSDVTPDKMFDFGLMEIERVKSRMKLLQEQTDMDSVSFQKFIAQESFFYTNTEDIQQAFEMIKKHLAKDLDLSFPFVDRIPDVKIARGTNKALAKAPAYYIERDSTFYYNYFETPFNKRQVSWIYIHEAMPGHHYQTSLDKILNRSTIQKLFEYNGFLEGYAAYVEEIGYEIGAYQNIYDELGKWEWDIIRSLRVAMDVGINYYDWGDDKALEFWQSHLQNKDDIALREIARMKRWPAQVITYKYGADKILKWKESYMKDSEMSLKEFHMIILEHGSLPFSVLENHISL